MEGSLFGDLTPESATLPESSETIEDIRRDIGDCVRCPLQEHCDELKAEGRVAMPERELARPAEPPDST